MFLFQKVSFQKVLSNLVNFIFFSRGLIEGKEVQRICEKKGLFSYLRVLN